MTVNPEDLVWVDTDKLVEAKDPEHYQKIYALRFGKATCDGKGPWNCEGYIGCPCDCDV